MREPDRFFHAEGNRGGSQIHLIERPNGMVELQVAETCVHTVDQEISVAALAVILTWAKDYGFQAICNEYFAMGGGSPKIDVEHDPAADPRRRSLRDGRPGLRDLLPTNGGHTVTDDEREAQIRQQNANLVTRNAQGAYYGQESMHLVLCRLDEARALGEARIGELTRACDQHRAKVSELAVALNDARAALARQAADYEEVRADHRRLVREIDVALNGDAAAEQASLCDLVPQIARLRAPPEADVVKRVDHAIARHTEENPDGTVWWKTGVFAETIRGLRASFIRELTEYGDQRARESEAATRALASKGSADMLERASEAVDSWDANSGFTMAEHVADAMRDCAREARAAVKEKAARLVEGGVVSRRDMAIAIRALPDNS